MSIKVVEQRIDEGAITFPTYEGQSDEYITRIIIVRGEDADPDGVKVVEWAQEEYPATRCQHSYDCGRWYRDFPQVYKISLDWEHQPLWAVKLRYHQNV